MLGRIVQAENRLDRVAILEELFGLNSQNCTSRIEPPRTPAAPPRPIRHGPHGPSFDAGIVSETCVIAMNTVAWYQFLLGIAISWHFQPEQLLPGGVEGPTHETAAPHRSNYHGQPICEGPRGCTHRGCPGTLCEYSILS